jgi:hypothetical protein
VPGGIERIVEIKLDAAKRRMLKKSIDAVKGLMDAAKKIVPDLCLTRAGVTQLFWYVVYHALYATCN